MHVELLIIHGKSSKCMVWSYYQKCNFHFISKHIFWKSKLIFIVANLFYFYLHILFWTFTFHLQGKYFAQRETKPAVLWLSGRCICSRAGILHSQRHIFNLVSSFPFVENYKVHVFAVWEIYCFRVSDQLEGCIFSLCCKWPQMECISNQWEGRGARGSIKQVHRGVLLTSREVKPITFILLPEWRDTVCGNISTQCVFHLNI